MENTGPKSSQQLCRELLENINGQLDVNMKLKETLEKAVAVSSKDIAPDLTEEIASEIKDIFVEAESLQAEGKAIFHQLFGIDAELQI